MMIINDGGDGVIIWKQCQYRQFLKREKAMATLFIKVHTIDDGKAKVILLQNKIGIVTIVF